MGQHENRKAKYNHVLKYTGLFGGVQGLTMLVSVVRNKLVSVLVGAAGLGIADLLNRTVTLVSNSSNFGVSFSAVRQLSEMNPETEELTEVQLGQRNHYVQVVRFWSLLTGLFGWVLCMVLSPVLGQWTMHSSRAYLYYIWLSPMIACLAVMGGEMALLKAFRRLKNIALISIFIAFSTLLITVPLYYFYRMDGIVPALLLSSIASLVITLAHSLQCVPWQLPLRKVRELVRDGKGIIRLGGAYILAAMAGDGADVAVRSFINSTPSAEEIGFYTAGFTLTVSYARMVFVAMDSDYFPRLSASFSQREVRNDLVNRQAELCLLLMVPFLTFFLCVLPVVLPLLYTSKFMPVYPMVCGSIFYMFFKAITTPVAYLPLAKGDSVTYFVLELLYDVVFMALVIAGFRLYGLVGAGVALSLSNLVDMVFVLDVYSRRYNYTLSKEVVQYGVFLGVLLALSVAASFCLQGVARIGAQVVCCVVATGFSYRILKRETTLVSSFWTKMKERRNRKHG